MSIKYHSHIQLPDSNEIKLGTSSDLRLYHDGSNSYINDSGTGVLVIASSQTNMQVGGANKLIVGTNEVTLLDNIALDLGTSGDFNIVHNGTNTEIENLTGNLNIKQQTNDGDINFFCDDGSGGVTTYLTLDGGITSILAYKDILMANDGDGGKLKLGASQDFQIYHDGSNSTIDNYTGNIDIINRQDNGDVRFFSDDGTGGTTEYFRVDGGQEKILFFKNSEHQDSVKGQFGNGGDFSLFHNGTDSYIENDTGDLYIRNNVNDKDIIFQSDDGSGGVTTYFYVDGSSTQVKYDVNLKLHDNKKLIAGDADDLQIYHDATNSRIENNVGDLMIQNFADDKDIKFMSDDGSGGTATYFMLDGSAGYTTVQKDIRFNDDVELLFGTDSDFKIKHNGSNGFIRNFVGDLYVLNAANDKDIIFQNDDGSGGTETYFFLDGSASGGNPVTIFPDSSTLRFGSGGDLQLYHDGANSYIAQTGTGDLYIRNTTDDKDIIFQNDDGSGGIETYFYLDGSANGANQLTVFPDGSNLAFGSAPDTYLMHNGTDFLLDNYNSGNIHIRNTVDDKDIILSCDDGSGGTTAYLTLDGSQGFTTAQKAIRFDDSVPLQLGSSADLRISHDGSTSAFIDNHIGDIYIRNNEADHDIYFQNDDGSGGLTNYFYLDGGVGFTIADKKIRYKDNVEAAFGSSDDMMLKHDGTDGFIQNYTGDLYIRNNTNDKDIVFQSDDGSGGNASYFRLDGSQVETRFHKATLHLDSVKAKYGDSGDLQIHHDGSNSVIDNNTGILTIQQSANNSDIILKCDDGAGNVVEYFRLDGSAATHDGSATTGLFTNWPDKSTITLGTGGDLHMKHNGTDTTFDNYTGHLKFTNYADDSDIVLQTDNGSGGVQDYIRLDGSVTNIKVYKDIVFADNIDAHFGTGGDLRIYHDGTDSRFQEFTGNLNIINYADDKDIVFQSDDGSGGITEYFRLDGSEGYNIASKHIMLEDNVELRVGGGADLKLYHDGSNNYIQASGTGDIIIEQRNNDKDIVFNCDDGSGGIATYFRLDGSSAVHDGSATTHMFTTWIDNSRIAVGTGRDFQINHDSTDTYLSNNTGDLIIQNNTNDKDIILRSDDGSGGTTAYITLDGSASVTKFDKITQHADNVAAKFGYGNDLVVFHDGTNNHITADNGDLTFTVNEDDHDIIFKSDDGSGGVTEYFRVDGGEGRLVHSVNSRYLDNVVAMFGTGADLQVYHDGSNSYISDEGTGVLYIRSGGSTSITVNGINTTFAGDLTLSGGGNIIDQGAIYIQDTAGGRLGFNRNTFNGSIHDSNYNAFQVQNNTSGADGKLEIQGYTTAGGYGGSFYLNKNAQPLINDYILHHGDENTKIGFSGSDTFIVDTGGTTALTVDSSQNATFAGDILVNTATAGGYIQIDQSDDSLKLADANRLKIGTGNDFQLYHSGTNSFITNNVGDINIINHVDNGDIKFQADDGSGGDTEYFRLDGSVADGTNIVTRFPDQSILVFGSGSGFQDGMQIYHNGTNSFVNNYVGNLEIRQETNDADLILKCDDGSGGITAYLTLDGSVARTLVHKEIRTLDNIKVGVGSGSDMQLYHNGSNTFITNGTGDLTISNTADDKDIIFQSDDGSGGTKNYFILDGSALVTNFPDNSKLTVGNGNDLQIYHDGSNSYISDIGTGSLKIQTSQITINNAAGNEAMINATQDGAVNLYYNGQGPKISTGNYGPNFKYSVTGTTDGNSAGDVVHLGESTTVAGKIYYYTSGGSWELVDADAASTCSGLLAVALGTSSSTNGMLLRGMVTIANDPGAVGDTLFASTTAGQATATAPSGSGDIVRVIGYCLDASNGQIWFNPDGAFVEVA